MFKNLYCYIVWVKFKLITNNRNRSDGWKYAKLSGHQNEKDLSELINNNKEFKKIVKKRLSLESDISKAEYGGLNEVNVKAILDGKTKSKTDLILKLNNDKIINLSIKKSNGGQVYLISVPRFITGFEKQFKKKISSNQQKAINLFFGSSKEAENIINQTKYYTEDKKYKKIKKYEMKRKRLTNKTLSAFDQTLSKDLLSFFRNNISDIFNFCFSTGLAKHKDNWAEYIWYINTIDNDKEGFIFKINNILFKIDQLKDIEKHIFYGERGGGTTINLPFGFVQWHQAQIQFHHSYEKIKNLCSPK